MVEELKLGEAVPTAGARQDSLSPTGSVYRNLSAHILIGFLSHNGQASFLTILKQRAIRTVQ